MDVLKINTNYAETCDKPQTLAKGNYRVLL